ncbi:hypothetical protein I4641_07605 [Waterburya agarophytonicola K14]|uniref:Uncharacterized protein n=1 Tax=Waterburya agarophytonicola KI4 TaxID=2874699 RepID=A0A964BQA4_9CYAN|nr:hypothetical protein [Waterburya agarophytonicola]MCC0176841.1 hypothetical protein [Waterburya agarophytonicola KI4]
MKPNFCLTSPVQLGAYTLANRIVFASNLRSQAYNHLPQPEAITYYGDLADYGLIITEPTLIAPLDPLSHYPEVILLNTI